MSAPVGVDLGQVVSTTAGGRTGRFALVEQLLADDIRYLFGNPGTVEQGFLDVLADYPAVRYVFALQ
jgi:thiamine pyrophosphate-dependent acetolactate synthase large subunit-like protein